MSVLSRTDTMVDATYFYRPQTTFAKVMFLHMSVCPQGGMHDREACMAGGMHGKGACVVGLMACMAGWGCIAGGMHRGGCTWQGACVVRGMHVRGACVAWGHAWQGACMACMPPGRYYDIQSMSGQYASYWNAFLW